MMNEDNFIITASRLSLSEEHIILLKDLSCKIEDWDYLLSMANVHKVASIIYYSLTKYGLSNLVPSNLFSKFKNIFYTTLAKNVKYLQLLEKIAGVCDEKIVLLKGIDLVESLYPNVGIRSMGDIDILVEKGRGLNIFDKILAAFCNENLMIDSPLHKSWVNEKLANLKAKHLPAICFKNGILEIHCILFKNYDHDSINDKVWDSIVLYKQSRNIYCLGTEFMLLHLCVHFYCDAPYFVRLRMLCDINELIIKYRETLNWELILYYCQNPSLRHEVTTALTYTYLYFTSPIPQDFIDDEEVHRTSRSLSELLSGIYDEKPLSLQLFFTDIAKIQKIS